MKYLLTLLVVLLLAAPAMSECNILDKHSGPANDNRMARDIGPYEIGTCTHFQWAVDFYRTAKETGSNTLIVNVEGSDANLVKSSNIDCPTEDDYRFPDEGYYTGTIGPLATHNTISVSLLNPTPTGYFHSIDVWVESYEQQE